MLFIDSLVSFRPLPLPAVLSLALFSSRFLLRPSSRPRFVVAGCLFFRRYIVSSHIGSRKAAMGAGDSSLPNPEDIPIEDRQACLRSVDLKGMVAALKEAKKVVCLCGAGISVSDAKY